jgi:hypothetical protein
MDIVAPELVQLKNQRQNRKNPAFHFAVRPLGADFCPSRVCAPEAFSKPQWA